MSNLVVTLKYIWQEDDVYVKLTARPRLCGGMEGEEEEKGPLPRFFDPKAMNKKFQDGSASTLLVQVRTDRDNQLEEYEENKYATKATQLAALDTYAKADQATRGKHFA